jgi:hypothetical protein
MEQRREELEQGRREMRRSGSLDPTLPFAGCVTEGSYLMSLVSASLGMGQGTFKAFASLNNLGSL